MNNSFLSQDPVLINIHGSMMTIVLNRPEALNSLNSEMIRLIRIAMDKAGSSDGIRLVLFRGSGSRAFCAGGDVKAVATAVKENRKAEAMAFFTDEYALDLCIHRFPKPVIAMVDGITMGGGLGLSAGADLIIATEKTRMAMPETRIGFFPDVGATGWMFDKCPPGYPEYLALTGYEIHGKETVRLGFSTHFMPSAHIDGAISLIHEHTATLTGDKVVAVQRIRNLISPFCIRDIPEDKDMDEWVRGYFAGKNSVADLLEDLSHCGLYHDLCQGVFTRLAERSPTATVLTLKLLRQNEGRPLEDVFAAETKAAEFMLSHPDYIEGIRARLVDKDDNPKWQPPTVKQVGFIP